MTANLPLLAYGSFWDVPRLFVIRDADRDLVFSSPFRDDLDEYDDEFTVFARQPIDANAFKDGWRWEDAIDAGLPVARVPVANVTFDASKRASVDAAVLDIVRRRAADPTVVPLITTVDQLRAADDPVHGERPPAFDEARERAGVEALINSINQVFGTECQAEIGAPLIQDASHFATIEIPAEATGGGEELLVRVSNFGRLVALANAALQTPASATDRSRLAALAAERGYRVVFAALLVTRYDGANQALKELWASHPEQLTWWTRFFDWL
jgi:hypothetical protein